MNAKGQIIVNAPASQLWKILVEDFDQISGWATAVLESGPNPQVPVGEGRVCLTALGRNVEVITNKDEKEQTFSYSAKPEKAPFFLKGIENTWTIKPLDDDRAEVSMNAQVELMPIIGLLVARPLKARMERGFAGILEEIKHYAETGEIHPRKQAQISSRKA